MKVYDARELPVVVGIVHPSDKYSEDLRVAEVVIVETRRVDKHSLLVTNLALDFLNILCAL